ncbi:TAXI family TRAP transporter solute-binding subunit [Nocardia flavorosea]|uniref:TAXI family TRAP transporter solute-binding subunit n=1 Tax=Nocardia flavorosea TaxID=53429 RepID=A0A846YB39_9NOCA|nr:TAXI family TRAP transporter solute-binding subunit [Nocardia flavorosea]NKY54984.1 TAXI family TRAP transporter solute-binding subunit [Nocardia flavorosea]
MSGSATRAPKITRRRVIGYSAATIACAAAGYEQTEPPRIRLGSGLPGDLFYDFGTALAAGSRYSPVIRIKAIPTTGSATNLQLLDRGSLEAALTLADTAAAVGTQALAIGRLYESYLHLAVPTDSGIQRISDLRGARVNIGVNGSGAAVTAERMLRSAGLEPGIDFGVDRRALAETLPAIRSGRVDALIWGDGIPTWGISSSPPVLRMLDLGERVQPMRDRFGYLYDRVPVPGSTYPGVSGFETIGAPVLLLVSRQASDDTVRALAELLLHDSHTLVPEHVRGFQFFDRRWLVNTGSIPLHPAAAAYYRSQHR